jgi:RNA polymerase sigma-70 factor (ECF subfamily)
MIRSAEENEIESLKEEGEHALASLFSEYQPRLEKMVRYRLDQRLWGRVDPTDVLQEAFLAITQRMAGYLANPSVPVFIWFRRVTGQILIDVHRRHLIAKARNANLELAAHQGLFANSGSMASQLAADMTSPSHAAVRSEMLAELREAFDRMDPIDREVLALRHFEELGNNEVAAILGIQKSAASNRYVRALRRLRTQLSKFAPSRSLPRDSRQDCHHVPGS